MNIIPLFATISLVAIIVGANFIIIIPIVNAQNNTSSSQLQNATENTGAEKKIYILSIWTKNGREYRQFY